MPVPVHVVPVAIAVATAALRDPMATDDPSTTRDYDEDDDEDEDNDDETISIGTVWDELVVGGVDGQGDRAAWCSDDDNDESDEDLDKEEFWLAESGGMERGGVRCRGSAVGRAEVLRAEHDAFGQDEDCA